MAIRNTVSIEFSVGGPGLQQLAAIENRLRNLGSASGGINSAASSLGRLGAVGSTAAAGVTRTTNAMHNLGAASTRTGGALQRIGEIVAGTLGGNLLAGIFTSAASAAASFAKESVGAALSMEQALVVLKTQSRLTGTDLAANLELAKQLAKEFKISQTAGIEVAGGGLRAAAGAGKPEETLKFLRAVADLTAAAGRPLSGLNETVKQLAAGGAQAETALDKIGGGANPGAIMDAYAKKVGVAADALTELQRNQAIYNFIMERSIKVQGLAQESLNSNTGRISTLSAAYDNIQTRLGTLIVQSTLFKGALDLLEKSVASLDKPEALANFNASFEKARFVVDTMARGIGILKAEFTLFGTQTSVIWDTFTTKIGNAFTQIGLELKQFANDAVLSIVSAIQAIPKPIRDAIGVGISESDLSAVLDPALRRKAEIDAGLQKIFARNNGIDAEARARLDKAQSDFNATIAGLPVIGAPGPGTVPAATSDQLKAFAGAAGRGAGAFAADFKLVPVTVETADGLSSGLAFQRVVREQAAASTDLGQKVVALTSIMEETNKNPAFARVEFVAGPDTLIKSVVPTGGAIP